CYSWPRSSSSYLLGLKEAIFFTTSYLTQGVSFSAQLFLSYALSHSYMVLIAMSSSNAPIVALEEQPPLPLGLPILQQWHGSVLGILHKHQSKQALLQVLARVVSRVQLLEMGGELHERHSRQMAQAVHNPFS
uniref:Uncharacterized protein n=1 Tax=Triticum urartu TaxID=4572 RepID=A0A8R7RFD5_TRIUA